MTATALYDYLERLTSLMRAWSREHPLLAELQPIHVSALQYLSRCNRYSNTPLAVTEYLGLTKGTVSQSLKALEAKGLIRKQPDARDRRSVHLVLTEQGRELVGALIPPTFLREAAEDMGEEAEQLVRMLDRLLGSIQRRHQVPSFGLCRSCRFHEQRAGGAFCGLTQESLEPGEGALICREHQDAA